MPQTCRFTFPSASRIRHSREFARVRRNGRKISTPHFIIYCLARPDGPTRLGLTVSRKVGGAVQRNGIKRLVREFFRQNRYCLPPHTDLSVIAKVGAGGIGFAAVREELMVLCAPAISDWTRP